MDDDKKKKFIQKKLDDAFRKEEAITLELEYDKHRYFHRLETLQKKYGPGLGVGVHNLGMANLFHHTQIQSLATKAKDWFKKKHEHEKIKKEIKRFKQLHSEL